MDRYIGISGITSREQIDAIVEGYPEEAPPLAMGVLGSYKTLILRQQNRYPNRYPKADDIRSIVSTDHRIRNVLHYSFAEDDMDPPRCGAGLWDELNEIRERTWPRDLWLQVNARPMIRPWQAEALARIANQWSGLVVQVSARAMDTSFVYLTMIMERLAADREKVMFLFDGSGGTGLAADVVRLSGWIGFAAGMGWSCGVAGGLSPETLPTLRPLFDICPLSVDTESWPRDADDRLDVGKARAFWQAALELYQ